MMLAMGIWWFIAGLVAIFEDTFFVVTEDYIFKSSTWGWIHLGLAVLVTAAAYGLSVAAAWARVVGVIMAVLAGVLALAWIPYYPVWGILFVVASVFVTWALTVHGEDVARYQRYPPFRYRGVSVSRGDPAVQRAGIWDSLLPSDRRRFWVWPRQEKLIG